MEWAEAQGRTVDDAVEAALVELKIDSRNDANIEIIQEPKSGFLGIGGQDAVVKVTRKPAQKRRRRRRSSKSSGTSQQRDSSQKGSTKTSQSTTKSSRAQQSSGSSRSSGSRKSSSQADRSGGRSYSKKSKQNGKKTAPAAKENAVEETNERSVTIEEQAEVAAEFLKGLLEAFGLEGVVTTTIDDEVLFIDVEGDQTEALVGAKGSIMQSVLELTRTVIQRKTYGAPRMRIDIAGYGERRRAALKIYTGKLVEKVLADQGEIMMEPMNPADRKVIHDSVGEYDGVRSFSEGEDPRRSVVIAPAKE